jgi:AbrB family looped-hinge helix DNA binding protein
MADSRRRWDVKVDGRGRVLLPDSLRRALGIAAGDVVTVTLEDGAARLLRLDEAIRRAQTLVRERVGPNRSLVDELLAERAAEGESETGVRDSAARPSGR